MLDSEKILKIKILYDIIDVNSLDWRQRISYELFPDGLVVKKTFNGNSRKCASISKSIKLTSKDFEELSVKINRCINEANTLQSYCDDRSATITILRNFGRVETMDRGLGNDEITVGEIITNYLRHKE